MQQRFEIVVIVAIVLVTSATSLSAAFSSQPVWDIQTSCNIPNEVHQGSCRAVEDCHAYQRINDLASLRYVGRLSFLRLLQCTGIAEGQICCPHGGASYRNPSMNESLPMRTPSTKSGVGMRFNADNDELCGQQDYVMKLLGGDIAHIDEFPWMAMLIYDLPKDGASAVSPGCGGALISKSFVVTAAHCLIGPVLQKKGSLKLVRLGEYDLNSDPDCLLDESYKDCTDGKVDVKPKRSIIHPQYSPNAKNQHHDIGLIELERPVQYSNFIQHICLPEPTSANGASPGNKLNVCGWGRTNFFRNQLGNNALSPVKLKVALPYVDHQNCREIYRDQKLELGSGQLCAGGRKAQDSCAGDSGSPLMFYDRKMDAWVLTGLVSLGVQKCGTEGKPGIYTNVKEYVGWIKQTSRI